MTMTQDEAVDLIKKLLTAETQDELQRLIGVHLPQMDNAFFAVLTEAAEVESTRNPAVGARLTSLAQMLLPLRTLI
jgi:hypothetical protein